MLLLVLSPAEAIPLQTITYTPFKKAKNIKQGDELFQTNFNELIISYGIDNERRKTIETKTENGNITATRTKFFGSNYELIHTTQNSSFQEKEILYIFAPDGLFAINETKNGVNKMYYLSSDHLGSINLIVDGSNGNVVDDLSYDSWGRNRNPIDWSYSNITLSSVTDRGYTSHEQLTNFGLINMPVRRNDNGGGNGRIYDPMTLGFLSPDPFVQNPSNSQNFNRFSYVLNNPLKYVDPSGYNYQYYIDGLPVSARMARKFMWDDVDLNFHSTRSGNMGANIDNFYPQRLSANADAINRAFNLYENLTGVALSYKNGNVGYWTSFSYNSPFKSSEIAGEGWSGVWPRNMTNHGAKFNSIFDVINDQLKAKQSFDEFNQKMSFWNEYNIEKYTGGGSVLLGATGYRIGSHMSSVSRYAPMVYNSGQIYRPALSGYKYGMLSGQFATKLGAGLRFGGNLLGGVGIFYTVYQMANNNTSLLKGSVDIGFGVVGFLGPIGLGVSSIYFIGDTFIPGGWQATPEHMFNQIQYNSSNGVWMNPYIHFK